MCLDRVLDGQAMEVEFAPDGVELVLGRLDHPDPGEAAGRARLGA